MAVHLTDGPITLQSPGDAESEAQPSQVGETSGSTMKDKPLTHRVHNVGTIPFEVIDVEFFQRPGKPSDTMIPSAAENPSARAYKWTLARGANSDQHAHTRPYLIMAVTSANLKMTTADGQSVSYNMRAGDVHWSDAAVTHTLTNSGGAPAQIVEIELK